MQQATARPKKAGPGRSARFLSALVFGGLLGAGAGALIGADLGGDRGAGIGALVGAMFLGPAEALTGALRRPGQTKPRVYQIVVGALFVAALGGLLALLKEDLSLVALGLAIGLLSGVSTLRLPAMVLGTVLGLSAGWIFESSGASPPASLLAGLVAALFRLLDEWLFPREEPVRIAAERVPASQVAYVVPFEANSNYIGAGYFEDLARSEGGAFKRNAPGIGIVETMDSLRGPTFDPSLVDPLIREFYEHTSRFKLTIVPVWRRRIRPLFWLYKRFVAQQMGQANLPFNMEEAQRGVVSYIDGIDFDCDDIIDLRGWVRAFEATGEAIYVGVYTTFRHEDVGYVSVGFPLPKSNFTATLLPYNHLGRNFLLKSHGTGLPCPGHYLSTSEDGQLTVLELPTFGEEIEVYTTDGRLRTDHRFYLANLNFLTLQYTMERIE